MSIRQAAQLMDQNALMREWIEAEVETAVNYWRPIILKAVEAAPHVEAVQELRGILRAFDEVMPQALAILAQVGGGASRGYRSR